MKNGMSQFVEFRRGLVDGGDWVLIADVTTASTHH